MAVAILRLPNGLDFSDLEVQVDNVDTTPPNGLATPNSSVTNLGTLENGISNKLRRGILQANLTNGNSIMHADSYLNISKIATSSSATRMCSIVPLGFSGLLWNWIFMLILCLPFSLTRTNIPNP